MFYILGGKFSFGSSSSYGPDFLMDTNVIVVCETRKLYRIFGQFYLDMHFSGDI